MQIDAKRNWGKGSFTVELACLMPIFLLVIMGSIYLCFYVHNRAWLQAAATESALIGNQESMVKGADVQAASTTRAQTLLKPQLFGAENLQLQVNQDTDKVQVQFDVDTVASFGGIAWHLKVIGESKISDPVSFIWKSKGLEGIIDEIRRSE